MTPKITYKFCGGCNPHYDRKAVYQILQSQSVSSNDDTLIILNGCPRACIRQDQYKNTFKTIIDAQKYSTQTHDAPSIVNAILNSIK